ncbi:MAG: PAS domain S-box protein, partial [Bryobacteraceae bacterium]|nr:PAS domain S-box protein [Bryobacteraceae bacterium]
TVAGLKNHTELRAVTGEIRCIDDSCAPIRNEKGEVTGAVLVFRDITLRRQAEQKLRLTEQRLSQLMNAQVVGVMFGTVDGRVVDANDEFLRMLGRKRAELQSGTLNWLTLTPPEHVDATQTGLEQAKQTGTCQAFEKEYFRPDGTRVPVLIGYVLLEPERERSVAFVVDLTLQKRSELRLRRLNEDLQLFTYGASHDLKEPLRMVSSFTQLLARRYAGQIDQQATEYVGFITEGVDRMRSVVDALMEYSKASDPGTPTHSASDPQNALNMCLVSLHSAIDESSAEITWDPFVRVLMNETHLAQVFQNLVGNAINYRGEAPPKIHLSSSLIDAHCEFRVQDNGVGVAPKFHESIFLAFHRLHGRERPGTGLGLATTRRLIEWYGGRIWVESEGEGRGSTFCFTVPCAQIKSA